MMTDPKDRLIDGDLLPVMNRRKTVFKDGDPLRKHNVNYVVANDGSILTQELPFHWSAFMTDAMNQRYIEREVEAGIKEPMVLLGRAVIDGRSLLEARKYAVRMGTARRPFIGLSESYETMLNRNKKKLLEQMAGQIESIPFKKDVQVTAILTVNNRLPVRISEILSTVIDLLLTCGIIVGDRQVASVDGSRVKREKGHKPTLEIVVRAWRV